jgi:hypothetical protein
MRGGTATENRARAADRDARGGESLRGASRGARRSRLQWRFRGNVTIDGL